MSLSDRGHAFASSYTPELEAILSVFAKPFHPQRNPDGVVNFGVAENSTLRKELTDYFNEVGLQLDGSELAYNNRLTTSMKLVEALCHLFNNVPDGVIEKDDWTSRKPLRKIEPSHVHIGNGAGGVINAAIYSLCDAGDGVLLSEPYYNGFLYDITYKNNAVLVKVPLPAPDASKQGEPDREDSRWRAPDTVELWEKAILDAKAKGIKTKVLLHCNPHNPTGQIISRDTTLALLKLAAKYDLHFISDEIYSRSIFAPKGMPSQDQFYSIFSIDTEREAGLHPSRVHMITSMSKDFSANGFRLGVLVSQSNSGLVKSLDIQSMPLQTATPAGNIWANWIRDTEFLEWYLKANRGRLAKAHDHFTDWLEAQNISYVPSYAGHFFMVDFRAFLRGDLSLLKGQRAAEAELSAKILKEKVFVAPGGQYEHPVPGWFRFTFTANEESIKEGLKRLEKALELKPLSEKLPLLNYTEREDPMPPRKKQHDAADGLASRLESATTLASE